MALTEDSKQIFVSIRKEVQDGLRVCCRKLYLDIGNRNRWLSI